MSLYLIEPEVPGYLGQHTIGNFGKFPPIVEKLHFEFDGWLNDDLIESFPCFLVTESLAKALDSAPLSGYQLESVEISTSEVFKELYPERSLPQFLWLRILGQKGKDDFSVSDTGVLLVSERALQLLQNFQLKNAEVEVYES